MNVKLTEVVSDVAGVTGMAIIKAILAGERDPWRLAALRDCRCKRSRADIERALEGNWRAEHLFALKQAVELHEFYRKKLGECDAELEVHLRTFADCSGGRPLQPRPGGRGRRRRQNDPAFEDVRQTLHRISGVDLTVLGGVDENTALVILGEVGPTSAGSRRPSTSRVGWAYAHFTAGRRVRSAVAACGVEPTVSHEHCDWRHRAAITQRMRWARSTDGSRRGRGRRRRSWRRRGSWRSGCTDCCGMERITCDRTWKRTRQRTGHGWSRD